MNLRPDVYAAQLDQDVVLLDVGCGQYFCLPDAAPAFELLPGAPPRILDPDLAEDAAHLGLVGVGEALAIARPPTPARDLPDAPSRRLGAHDLASGLAAFGVLLGRYHGRSFGKLLAYAVRERRADRPRRLAPGLTDPNLTDQVQAFRQILPWAPFQGVCLYRSFFLLAFLRRRGLDATWMFGVRTWPFEAHCWLQVDDLVLDDNLDHVRPFTPILAI